MADAFEKLGIEKGASIEEIRKAHRDMARRWHPDRFQEGPERMWAERRMVEINIAFEEALSLSEYGGNGADVSGEREKLEDVRKLIGLGELVAARRALMRVSTRSAEWNYLFGAVLFRLGEMEKAVLYFGIAARQKPDNEVYRSAYLSAETVRNRENRRSFNRLLGAVRRRSGRREP